MKIDVEIARNGQAVADAQEIRKQVFVSEQGIPAELDSDGLDGEAYHALACDSGKAVGTARLVPEENHGAVLARVAVLPAYRGHGIASRLIRTLEAKAGELGIRSVVIHPHEHLRLYYESKGYRFEEKGETVGGHPLLKMSKNIESHG